MPLVLQSFEEQTGHQTLTIPQVAAPMTDLHTMLSRLGLAQYTERFSEEGFETWETVLDITESDL